MEESRYIEEDFSSFIQELIDTKRLSDSKEEGIAKYVVSHGYEALSEKQRYVFLKSIEPLIFDKCNRCGIEIPWCEMSTAELNGGLCSWCQQLSSHDD